MKLIRLLLLALVTVIVYPQPAGAQTPPYVPTPVSAYVNNGSSWGAWTSGTGSGAVPTAPIAIALYCQTISSTAWTPCNPSGGSFMPAGAWSSVTNYGAGYVVSYAGVTYYSLLNGNLNQEPDTSPTFWYALSNTAGSTVLLNPIS